MVKLTSEFLQELTNLITNQQLAVNAEQEEVIDSMNVATGWTVLGNDTINLDTTTIHVTGTAALSFDKTDGAANTVFAAIQRTIDSRNLSKFGIHSVIDAVVSVTSVAAIDYFFVRLGTDSSNYNEWRIDADEVTVNEWVPLILPFGNSNPLGSTGDGWDQSKVTYVVVGAAFDTQDDALAEIKFDNITIHSSLTTDTTGGVALNPSTSLIGKVQPFSAVLEGGLTELIGINEQVAQNEYSGSIGIPLGDTYSGEILNITIIQTEDDAGDILAGSGVLFIYDTDPTISSGDSAMTAADAVTVIGKVDIFAGDWEVDANSGVVHKTVAIGFHSVSSLYFAYKHTGATTINSGASDDEQFEINFEYRRDS